jgi:Adenylylsulphate kinase
MENIANSTNSTDSTNSSTVAVIAEKINTLFDLFFDRSEDSFSNEFCPVIILGEILEAVELQQKSAYLKMSESQLFVLAVILDKIATFLQSTTQLTISNGAVQETHTITLIDYFKKIREQHYHRAEKNGVLHICPYHEESLFVHLILTCITSIAHNLKSVDTDNVYESEDEMFLIGLTGLFHDLGKMSTMKFITITKPNDNGGNNNGLSYPFHGEMGSGILAQLWNPSFGSTISLKNWETMCRAICVHMCGYHENDSTSVNACYKWSLLQIENTDVKQLLLPLSIGDSFSAFRFPHVENDVSDVIMSREKFASAITHEFDFVKFVETYGLTNGLVILMRGMSGSGKSTVSNMIRTMLESNGVPVVLVERDALMCKVSAEHMGETYDLESKADGGNYPRFFNNYEKNKKALSKKVNALMTTRILDGLVSNSVVIIDTVMNLFDGIDFVLPPIVRTSFVISVDVVRNCEMLEDGGRLGISLEEQIKISGDRTMESWLPTSSLSRTSALTSVSTITHVIDSFSTNFKIKVSRPRLSHVVAWNSMSTEYVCIGETLRQIAICTNHLSKTNIAGVTGVDGAIEHKSDDQLDIITYANNLYLEGGWNFMIDAIAAQGFVVSTPIEFKSTDFANRVVKIKYIDNNKKWRPIWTRQCRGICMFLNNENKIVPIKYLLQKGAEVLTGLHIDAHILGTQDVENTTDSELSVFDDVQIDTMKRLLRRDTINGVLSFKTDGSLLGVTVYFGEMAKIVDQWIELYGDAFTKAFGQTMKTITGLTCVLSTQGTYFIGNDMQNYMTTAILGIISTSDDALNIAGSSPSSADFMSNYGTCNGAIVTFCKNIATLTESNKAIMLEGAITSCTISFEAICASRKSIWGDLHTELAVSYPNSFVRYLGMSVCSDTSISFHPHFATINSVFDEPYWWNITHSSEIESMLTDLSKVIRRTMTTDEYLEIHPIHNVRPVTNGYFDFEGFVFYTVCGESHIVNSDGRITFGLDTVFDYGKIKTQEYYNSHKFRPENVGYLIELAETASDIFPLTYATREFFTNVKTGLTSALLNVLDVLSTDESLLDCLPEKARNGFRDRPRDVQMKILVNSIGEKIYDICYGEFVKTFPLLHRDGVTETDVKKLSEIKGTLKSIVMKFSPWSSDFENNVNVACANIMSKTDEKSMLLKTLFGYCVQCPH